MDRFSGDKALLAVDGLSSVGRHDIPYTSTLSGNRLEFGRTATTQAYPDRHRTPVRTDDSPHVSRSNTFFRVFETCMPIAGSKNSSRQFMWMP